MHHTPRKTHASFTKHTRRRSHNTRHSSGNQHFRGRIRAFKKESSWDEAHPSSGDNLRLVKNTNHHEAHQPLRRVPIFTTSRHPSENALPAASVAPTDTQYPRQVCSIAPPSVHCLLQPCSLSPRQLSFKQPLAKTISPAATRSLAKTASPSDTQSVESQQDSLSPRKSLLRTHTHPLTRATLRSTLLMEQ